ncbi:MAG: PAS domain S-box protein [Terracidiphilus sp.]
MGQSGCTVQRDGLLGAVEHAADGIVITDKSGNIQYVNPAFTALTGYSCEEAVGSNPRFLKSGRQPAAFYEELWNTILSGQVWHGEVTNRRKDGTLYDEEMRIAPIKAADGVVTGYIAVKHDVTEQRAAQDARAFLAAIVEGSQDGIVAFTPDGKILTWNRGAEAISGYTAEEAIGHPISMLAPPERLSHLMELIEHVLQGKYDSHYEGQGLRKDGRIVHIFITTSPVRDSAGGVMAIAASIRDITGRKREREALRESEERFRVMADGCPVGICVTDAQGVNRFVNRTYLKQLGITTKQSEQGDWKPLIHPDDAPQYIEALGCALREHTPFKAERRSRRADGEWRWIESIAEPRFSHDGEFLGLVGASKDVTDRVQAEQALRSSEEKFRQLAENIREVFWMMNAAGTEILYVGPAYEEIWGRTCKSLYESPMDWMEAIHPDDRELAHATFISQLQGESIDSEYRINTPDGRQRWIRDQAFPVRDENGELIRIAGIAEDITERKRADQALRSSEEKFRQLAENIREVFRIMPIALDETLYVSPAYEEIWGRTMESVYRNPESWREAVHPDDREQSDRMAAHQLLGKTVEVEYRIQTPAGEQKWIRDRAFPVRDQGGELIRIAGIAEDITERKRAEQAILASHEFVQSTIDALSSSMCVLDETGTIIEVNRTWKDFAVANRSVHFHECSEFSQLQDQFGAGVSYLEACDRAVANGAVEAGDFAAGIRSLLHGDMEEFTKEYACHAPHERRWFVAKVTRFFTDGLPRVVVEHVNITTRKLAEEAMRMAKLEAEAEGVRANELAREAEKATAAKSEFLANMSHEIRTPMNGIIGMTGLLLDTELTAEQRRYAELARGSGESLLRLINDILDFSKIEAKKLELESIDFDLRSLLDNLVSILRPTAQDKGIELLCTTDPAIPAGLRGDPGRLRQILTNLAGNAIKFTDKGEVVVRVALAEEGESDCLLRFSVRDTGIGIGEDKIGGLFQKFSQVEVSTTRKYGGTGLGLAISKQLVEMMAGGIGVTSQEGTGSEFWFTVRLGRSLGLAGQVEGAELEGQTPARLHGRILVAEDNSTNREVALAMLRKFGVRADAVADGAEAVRALESIPYDLVLMDMRMPVMDGIEATRQIRNPQSAVLDHLIPVIALTANAMQSDRQNCLASGMNDFVPKPIVQGVLRDALQKWLPTGASAIPAAASLLEPAQTNEIDTKVFDPASVWSRLEGDNELVQIVFETFLADVPQQIDALQEFVKCENYAGVARQAHSIRGASANVGGESLRNLAAQMEKAADAGDWRLVLACMDELELQFSLLKNAIEANGPAYTK